MLGTCSAVHWESFGGGPGGAAGIRLFNCTFLARGLELAMKVDV